MPQFLIEEPVKMSFDGYFGISMDFPDLYINYVAPLNEPRPHTVVISKMFQKYKYGIRSVTDFKQLNCPVGPLTYVIENDHKCVMYVNRDIKCVVTTIQKKIKTMTIDGVEFKIPPVDLIVTPKRIIDTVGNYAKYRSDTN